MVFAAPKTPGELGVHIGNIALFSGPVGEQLPDLLRRLGIEELASGAAGTKESINTVEGSAHPV